MSKPIKFTHLGLPCEVRLQPLGHYCGYVGVPEDHPAYRADDEYLNLSAHGGITYSAPLEPDDLHHYFGFDCAHFDDGRNSSETNWRDAAYASDECRSLAEQLSKVAPQPKFRGVPVLQLDEAELRDALLELLTADLAVIQEIRANSKVHF